MKKGVIYARYSSDAQSYQSIEGQCRECHKKAEELGIEIVREYIDEATSGKNDNRPNFRKMINDSAFGTFDVVITWKMDRFARNRTDSALYKKLLKDNGVKVIYAAENIPEGNEGIILESVLEGLAEYYSLDLVQKITRGKKESVQKGKHTGGKPLYGYKITTEKYYEIDETIAPIIRKIFKDYVSGVRAVDIADNLNAAGIKTGAGYKWNRNKIGQLLRNEKYAGVYKNFGVQSDELIPQIIDKATFEAAQKVLEQNRLAGGRHKAKYKYLLTGKIKCGQCGFAMCANSNGITKTNSKLRCYYACSGKRQKNGCKASVVNRDIVEAIVIENTMNIVLQDDFIKNIADQIVELNKMDDNSSSLISAYEAELKEVKSKIDNLMIAIEEGVASKRMTDRISDLEKREEQLEEQLVFERALMKQSSVSKEQIIYWLSMFKDGDAHSPEFIEKLIKLFIKKVVVNLNTIEIHYNYIKDNNTNKPLLVNFSPKSWDTANLVPKRLSKYQMLYISKEGFYLEVMRP